MYVSNLQHVLDGKGAIGPDAGPALAFAQFLTGVVAGATDVVPRVGPHCIKCNSIPVNYGVDEVNKMVVWKCPACGEGGTISGWQGSFWDMTELGFVEPN